MISKTQLQARMGGRYGCRFIGWIVGIGGSAVGLQLLPFVWSVSVALSHAHARARERERESERQTRDYDCDGNSQTTHWDLYE